MNQEVVHLKVFLYNDGTKIEARRFTVDDPSVITSFLFMREKIQLVFPVLRNKAFKITWCDSDEDYITVVTDEDLITAFTEMTGNVKTLYVMMPKENDDNLGDEDVGFAQPIYGRVVCDSCEKHISGFRYKCMQCPDFDLCSNCEQRGLHSQHIMMRSSQLDMPRCMPKLMTCLSRSIRKAGIHASKDAYRAARHCTRSASFAGCPAGDQRKKEHEKNGGQKKNECPIREGALFDFAAPILEALHGQRPATAAAGVGVGPTNQIQPDLLGNIVRNVVYSIFGGEVPAADAQTQPQSAPTGPPPAAAANPQTTVNPVPNSSPQSASGSCTPMDVEHPKNDGLYPRVPEELSQVEKAPDAGWTFIQPHQQPMEVAPLIPVPVSAPTAPQAPPAPVQREKSNIAEGLGLLLDMGFTDEEQLVSLLKRFDGNVPIVVKYLFETNN